MVVGPWPAGVTNPRAGQRAGETDYNIIKTVCVTPGEVQKVDGNFDPPRCRVFSVWLPFVSICED